MNAKLYVCHACKAGEVHENDADRPGARLFAALQDLPVPDGVEVVGVKCLSACSQGAAVALAAPGKWSYVYGRMGAEDASDILTGAAAYAASSDGLVPWRERILQFRKQSLARVPPMPLEALT
ncbi:MAG: DUF1636 domain-containing protein [Pseudomonadota bacterium]